ncbi:Alpha/Beta hydrolase protein [Xylogone sp. PMI_703]|nr:Alpha/Beta hydrolase protein [Xylogone sp. PMI_703]
MSRSQYRTSVTIQSPGNTYSYISIPRSQPERPVLLFLHGFPSTSHDWRNQISHFSELGYGIIAPDLLGYGGSSKPLDPEAYIGRKMAADINALLDHENINEPIIGIAHDWGTYLLSQLAVYHGERFQKYVFLSTPYSPPGRVIDIPAINARMKGLVGYETVGYWSFLAAQGSDEIIRNNWESLFDLCYTSDPQLWATHLGPEGALKRFIESGSTAPLASWVTADDKALHHTLFNGNYKPPLMWYRRAVANLGVEEERARNLKNRLDKPTLMVTGTKDAVALTAVAKQVMEQLTEEGYLKVVGFDTGHWIQLDKATELNQELETFFGQETAKL